MSDFNELMFIKNNQAYLSSEIYNCKYKLNRHEHKFNSFDTRINNAFKRLNKLENDLTKKLKSDKEREKMIRELQENSKYSAYPGFSPKKHPMKF